MKIRFERALKVAVVTIVTGALIFSASIYYRLTPLATVESGTKYLAVRVLRYIYSTDLRYNQEALATYWIGSAQLIANIRNSYPPFIYEEVDEHYLQELRDEFALLDFLETGSNEYEAQLKLAAWLGTRWDHGTSPLRGGKEQLNPLNIIKEGEGGAKYWCEIAAIVTVQTATALGWPARLISLSRDGYAMQHGVAELWSNQFNKWYVVDTDFNVVYEREGIPLSAFELCHYGDEWQKKGQLNKIIFAPAKPSLTYQNLLPFYRYVFIDLRNDWFSRDLRRGSPAGSDLATFWTARDGSIPVLTSAQRVNRKGQFDWLVNQTWIKVGNPNSYTSYETVELAGYSPYFDYFELQFDGGPWLPLNAGTFTYPLPWNVKKIDARMVTFLGHRGPTVTLIR